MTFLDQIWNSYPNNTATLICRHCGEIIAVWGPATYMQCEDTEYIDIMSFVRSHECIPTGKYALANILGVEVKPNRRYL